MILEGNSVLGRLEDSHHKKSTRSEKKHRKILVTMKP